MKIQRWAVLAISAALVVAACSGEGELSLAVDEADLQPSTDTTDRVDQPIDEEAAPQQEDNVPAWIDLTRIPVPLDHDAEGARGVLRVDDNCTIIEGLEEGPTLTVIWPLDRTTWDAQTQTVIVDGQELVDGDIVEISAAVDELSFLPLPRSECPSMRVVVVEVQME